MASPGDKMNDPLLTKTKQLGGFRTLPFIMASGAFERIASVGLLPNMILYLTREYGMDSVKASDVVLTWCAATNFTPLLGAFVADSYLGRFPMIAFGYLACFLGATLLWLTTMLPQVRPPACDQFSDNCSSATSLQLLLLYTSLGLLATGAGGIRSSALAFGADQLGDKDNPKNTTAIESYVSWYITIVSVSVMIAITCIAYIQDALGWKIGFGIPVVLIIISALSFFLASPFYIRTRPNKASSFTTLAQVLVASWKNRVHLSTPDEEVTYHCKKETTILSPSDKLRFLNNACIIRNPEKELRPDGRAVDQWSLCTVNQVEELKAVIGITPIWFTGVMLSINNNQTFPVLQATTMDRHILPSFEIPPGCMGAFNVGTLILVVALYDHVIIPVASTVKGKPTRLSMKQRMGVGMLVFSASMATFAFVESIRREIVIMEGYTDSPEATVQMSVMWVLPYHALQGLGEAMNSIGQTQFYFAELPKSMSSVASALFSVGMSVANLLATFIMDAVDSFRRRGGGEGWIPSNVNNGHYDYYFWLLTGLSLANFIAYVALCRAYGPSKEDSRTSMEQEERSASH